MEGILQQKMKEKRMKKRFTTALFSLCAYMLAGTVAEFSFDKGENIDMTSGTIGVSGYEDNLHGSEIKGLISEDKKMKLTPAKSVDMRRFFQKSEKGKALLIGVDSADNNRKFSYTGNLPKTVSAKNGGVSCWITPVDWIGSQNGKFRIFLELRDKARKNSVLVYKYHDRSEIFVLLAMNGKYESITMNISKWSPGERHFVAARWTNGVLVLYVDDKRVDRACSISEAEFAEMRLGNLGWQLEAGLSLIDDIKVFDGTVTDQQISNLYSGGVKVSDLSKNPIHAALPKTTVAVDGNINPGEYSWSSNLGFNPVSGTVETSVKWYLGRDDKYIYFATEQAAPDKKVFTGRDQDLWEDDSVEIFFKEPNSTRQFIVNANNAIFDSRNSNVKWNANGLKVANKVNGGKWTLEFAVPLSELEHPAGKEFSIGFCRNRPKYSARFLCASPLKFSYVNHPNYIRVMFDDQAAPAFWTFTKMPSTGGTLLAAVTAGADGKANVKFRNKHGRLLANRTFPSKGGKIDLNVPALEEDGLLELVLSGKTGDYGMFKTQLISAKNVDVAYLIVDRKTQVMQSHLKLSPPLSGDKKILQRLTGRKGTVGKLENSCVIPGNTEVRTWKMTWDLTKLPPGDYDYNLYDVAPDGKETLLYHQWFFKPAKDNPWEDFKDGLEDVVLKPWFTPIVGKNSFEILKRKYVFENTLFPSQIFSENLPILNSPIVLSVNGSAMNPKADLEILEKKNEYVVFRTKAKALGYDWSCKWTLYFDGWMTCDLSFTPGNDAQQIKNMYLQMPMNQEHSELVNNMRAPDGNAAHPQGKFGKQWVYDIITKPSYLWIGNAERGLFWGADSMRGTHIKNTNGSALITRSAGLDSPATMQITLVDTPFLPKQTRTIRFGIEATPVKDYTEEAKKFPFLDDNRNHIGWNWQSLFDYLDPEYFNPKSIASNARYVKNTFYGYCCAYTTLRGISPYWPQWAWYCADWFSKPDGMGFWASDVPPTSEARRNKSVYTGTCLKGPGLLNLKLQNMVKFLDHPEFANLVKDLYFDISVPGHCFNMNHGCAWVDDFGITRPGTSLSDGREFYLRLRKILKKRHPDGLLYVHPTSALIPPVIGLTDMILDGEFLVSTVAQQESYFDLFRPDLFRAAAIGKHCGARYYFICQFERAVQLFTPGSRIWHNRAPKHVLAVRHFTGYMLVHGNNIMPYGAANGKDMEKVWDIFRKFGYNEKTEFIPYWNKELKILKSSKDVMVSVYKNPEKLLAVAMNDTKQVQNVVLAAPAGKKAFDPETGKEYTIKNGTVSFKLASRDMRFVEFR